MSFITSGGSRYGGFGSESLGGGGGGSASNYGRDDGYENDSELFYVKHIISFPFSFSYPCLVSDTRVQTDPQTTDHPVKALVKLPPSMTNTKGPMTSTTKINRPVEPRPPRHHEGQTHPRRMNRNLNPRRRLPNLLKRLKRSTCSISMTTMSHFQTLFQLLLHQLQLLMVSCSLSLGLMQTTLTTSNLPLRLLPLQPLNPLNRPRLITTTSSHC